MIAIAGLTILSRDPVVLTVLVVLFNDMQGVSVSLLIGSVWLRVMKETAMEQNNAAWADLKRDSSSFIIFFSCLSWWIHVCLNLALIIFSKSHELVRPFQMTSWYSPHASILLGCFIETNPDTTHAKWVCN